ncbi:MAG TPA: hypothetical protein VGJ03_04535 [Acidimicrobiales bacterium]|jgi:GABA permease
MRRILIVAHKTLAGEHLREEVKRRLEEGECSFHLLVPEQHPNDHAWTDGEVERAAEKVLEEGLQSFRELDPTGGTAFTGEVGEANPLHAVDLLFIRGESFDEIIVSTLPPGRSHWLKKDVPTRMRHEYTLPITHVVADRVPAH